MAESVKNPRNCYSKYEMIPPEGGWGYAITGAVSLAFIVGLMPVSVFGVVFGPFLAGLGDEISATSLVTSIFDTSLFFAGLPASYLLQNYTYRKVGLAGAVIYSSGNFLTIFAGSIFYMAVAYLLQGFGFGLMFAAILTGFNEYWVIKKTVMMSVIQITIGTVAIVFPTLTSKLLQEYGFRGTIAIFSAFTLNGILALLTMQPVKWHYKRREIAKEDMRINISEVLNRQSEKKTEHAEKDALLDNNYKDFHIDPKIQENFNTADVDIASAVTTTWKTLVERLDLMLFKDAGYVNNVVGVSLALTSDVAFVHVTPAVLNSYGFNAAGVTFMLTTFFASDLIGKISLGVFAASIKISNRQILLVGSIFVIAFRVAYTLNTSFWWIATLSALLGFLRSTIQTTYSLVFAERYGPRFPTAFSLFMVICGIISLLTGLLSGVVKNVTSSDTMVVHFLTLMYLCCTVSWVVELVIRRRTSTATQ
ncbi:hypothetical protein Trydic_g9764 [Trypoxylus dichotomus]